MCSGCLSRIFTLPTETVGTLSSSVFTLANPLGLLALLGI